MFIHKCFAYFPLMFFSCLHRFRHLRRRLISVSLLMRRMHNFEYDWRLDFRRCCLADNLDYFSCVSGMSARKAIDESVGLWPSVVLRKRMWMTLHSGYSDLWYSKASRPSHLCIGTQQHVDSFAVTINLTLLHPALLFGCISNFRICDEIARSSAAKFSSASKHSAIAWCPAAN